MQFFKNLLLMIMLSCLLFGCSKQDTYSIAVADAQEIVENYFMAPNVGVQASHEEANDIEINGITYYYFDIIYGLLMGDKPQSNAVSRIFVNSNNKSLYMVVETSNGKLIIGDALTKSSIIQ